MFSFAKSICMFAVIVAIQGSDRNVELFEQSDSDADFIQQRVELAKKHLLHEETRHGGELSDSEKCWACKLLATTLYTLVVQKRPENDIVEICTAICIKGRIQDERVCRYITREYKDMAITVVQQAVLSPDQICGTILGPSCATPYNPLDMWNITLPNTPKPPVKPPQPPAPGSPKVRFLQLTDIHIDMMYQPGRSANCNEPLCCRSNDGKPGEGEAGAGRWGDYRSCDAPLSLVDNLFQDLATKADQIDFVIFTGDITAHDVWNQSRSDQLSALERLVSYFDKYLPRKQVYFCAGNHDSAPCDSFPPSFITGNNSVAWMYSAMADNWGRWLPQDTRETIMRGGFYTMSPFPGFRVISVNDIFCYSGNWWLMINNTDPAGQLQWLAETLQSAEDAGEKVFILTHIPTDCMKSWSWNYYNIVSRYESTIVGQFNGHTHTDEFRVYYDVGNLTRPVNVAYVAGSVTPYSNNNPNYRIYTMDGFYANSSFAILDYEDYVFDLRKNNNGSSASWDLEYSPLTEYGMKGSYPSDWNNLIYRMKDDDDLFNKFNTHKSRGGDLTPCTRGCKTDMLCHLKSGRSDDPELCRDLWQEE
ncbi:sphingomyelin phosphodiesterase-like [Haliotis cracherodii]|uniref:sphingomyelin phosphodiesterase-like n=1 Tax=Haliotis cracherodii TaxID=6455 RepID=UPI0039EC9669